MDTLKGKPTIVQELIERKLHEIASKTAGVGPPNDSKFFDENRNEDYFEIVFNSINLDMKLSGSSLGGQILDLGSGCGTLVKVCKNHGLDATGVEPDGDKVQVAKLKGVGSNMLKGVGEFLPFRDESFDVVTSLSVLEHVRNPNQVLRESVRILKKEGVLYLNAPDYSRCFHEGHYQLFWIPLIPKRMAKLYVKFRGRTDSEFLDSLQYVTKKSIIAAFRNLSVQIVDLASVRMDYRRAKSSMKVRKPVETINSPLWRNLMILLKMLGSSDTALLKLCGVYYSLLSVKARFAPSVAYVVRKSSK